MQKTIIISAHIVIMTTQTLVMNAEKYIIMIGQYRMAFVTPVLRKWKRKGFKRNWRKTTNETTRTNVLDAFQVR